MAEWQHPGMPDTADDRAHRRRRMTGRDPHEEHRSATPLELLYDLTFVVAFGIAADELAHFLADGHFVSGVFGFCFATFASREQMEQLDAMGMAEGLRASVGQMDALLAS